LSITPENKSNLNQLAKRWIADYHGFLECLKKFGDCDYYVDKIAEWNQHKLSRHSLIVVNPMKCGMVVLTHGDYWLNNLMFKFNESKEPEDVQMLDFQSSAWGTPSLDLHYFLISSVHDNIKVEYYDEFIEHYHDEFCKSLKKLKYDQYIPTLDDLYEDMLDKSEMGK
jgi:aminoglycoside phosphotransferase (APT) family kinase protein